MDFEKGHMLLDNKLTRIACLYIKYGKQDGGDLC